MNMVWFLILLFSSLYAVTFCQKRNQSHDYASIHINHATFNQPCTIILNHLSVLLFEVLEETSLEGLRSALDSEYHDGDNDAKQNDRESNDQAVHVLIVIEEFGNHLIVAGQYRCAGTDGVNQQRDGDVLAECGHLYQNMDIKSCPNLFDLMRSGVLWLLTSLLVLGACNELQEALNCLNEYMESLRDTMSPRLFEVFKKSYPNTLETTIKNYDLTPGKQSAYIITGDIEAMWLRDSTNQFLPYIRIPKECTHIRALARGLINTQAQLIMLDPYTNAFKKFQTQISARHGYLNDKTTVLVMGIPVDLCRHRQFATKGIWQRKFQIDSLASFLRLAYEYQLKYGTIDFLNIRVIKAIKRIMSVVDEQTKDLRYENENKRKFYTFFREPRELPNGQISASSATGMIKTGFRPSDDPNTHPYNIPGNAMMSTYLQLVAQKVLDAVPKVSVFKRQAMILSTRMKVSGKSISQAIYEFGVLEKDGKKVFTYEVNGRGESVIFDDANLPSLVSLAYLGFVSLKNEIYSNTRAYMLSNKNPFFYQSQQYKGIGSSHTPVRTIWPLALITQILTSNSDDEIKQCLKGLLDQANDNLIHESFSVDNPRMITRNWFAWANSLFGEAIIKLATERPDLLK